MFTANQENLQHWYTLSNCTQCMDIDHSTFCSNYSHHTHLPWRNHKIYYSKEANSHLVTTPSLQCYSTQLPSTPTLWKFSLSSQYFSGHGKPEHNQHIIIRSLYMATLRETPEWEPASTLSQHSFSSNGTILQTHNQWHFQYITPFTSPKESTGDTASIWTLFSHTRVYVMAIGSLIPAGLGIFCCYFFWCQTARLACWPLQPGTMQYTIVDDDVEAAPIYRCDSKAQQPTRLHKIHGLHMGWVPIWTESLYKQQM